MTFQKLTILAAVVAAPLLCNAQPAAVRIAPTNEPGEQIIITGTVFNPEGTAPVPGARIFVYQPDSRGQYAGIPGEPKRVARLRGILTADNAGRFSFATIKPGQYPKRKEPAHIRVHVAPPGTSDVDVQRYNWAINDLWFAGDDRIPAREIQNAREKGRFTPIIVLQRRGNVSYGSANLRLSYR